MPAWPPTEAVLKDCAERLRQSTPCADCVHSLQSRRAGFCRGCVSSLRLDSILAVAVASGTAFTGSGRARPGSTRQGAVGASTARGGVGYGGAAGDEKRVASAMEQQKNENVICVHRQISVFRELAKLLRPLTGEFFSALLFAVIPLVKESLRFSWLEISEPSNRSLLEAALDLCRSHVPGFADLLVVEFGITRNFQVVQELSVLSELRRVREVAQNLRASDTARIAARIVEAIAETVEGVMHRARVRRVRAGVQERGEPPDYVEVLKPLQVRWLDEFKMHKFKTSQPGGGGPEKMRRIRAEILSLSSSLPLHKNASIFLLLSEARLDLMKVLIVGPVDTPYEFGLWEFHVQLTSEYPNRPPIVHLMTTGGGSVRFGPNLYACGKVCLSLLGTWQGPGWMPGQSTLLQLFVTIQSIILVAEPYFLEPGHENQGNSKASEEYNKNVLKNTFKIAIEQTCKSPPDGFADVVKQHFTFHKAAIDAKAKANNLPSVQW